MAFLRASTRQPRVSRETRTRVETDGVPLEMIEVVFNIIDAKGKGFITPKDIHNAFLAIGVRVTKKKAEEAVWEVDSNSDGVLTYDDFVDVFAAAPYVQDDYAPSIVLNLMEFLMYDLNCTGVISVEDCMDIVCRRFDHSLGEAKIRKFLADSNVIGIKTLTFAEFERQIDIRRKLMK